MPSRENRRQLDELQGSLEGDWTREDGASEFQSSDGTQLIKVKLLSRGVRDLHAALIQIALLAQDRPELTRAYLIAQLPRMTPQRAQEEWQRAVEILRADTAKRLAFIGIGADAAVVLPDDLAARRLASSATQALRQAARQSAGTSSRMSIASFQVWKVLLRAWLSREGALRVAEIARRAGCSYPTVAKTLDRLEQRGEILRATSRSVTLQGFPRASLREVLVLAESLRRPIPFVDVAGAESRPQSLLRRLQEQQPPQVILAGVAGARHYDPRIDLHGLPRLDVMMPEPIDLAWVRRLDPALRRASTAETAPTLVLRPTRLADPQGRRALPLPVAGPEEILLDLYELGLEAQARDLVNTLRSQRGGT